MSPPQSPRWTVLQGCPRCPGTWRGAMVVGSSPGGAACSPILCVHLLYWCLLGTHSTPQAGANAVREQTWSHPCGAQIPGCSPSRCGAPPPSTGRMVWEAQPAPPSLEEPPSSQPFPGRAPFTPHSTKASVSFCSLPAPNELIILLKPIWHPLREKMC